MSEDIPTRKQPPKALIIGVLAFITAIIIVVVVVIPGVINKIRETGGPDSIPALTPDDGPRRTTYITSGTAKSADEVNPEISSLLNKVDGLVEQADSVHPIAGHQIYKAIDRDAHGWSGTVNRSFAPGPVSEDDGFYLSGVDVLYFKNILTQEEKISLMNTLLNGYDYYIREDEDNEGIVLGIAKIDDSIGSRITIAVDEYDNSLEIWYGNLDKALPINEYPAITPPLTQGDILENYEWWFLQKGNEELICGTEPNSFIPYWDSKYDCIAEKSFGYDS